MGGIGGKRKSTWKLPEWSEAVSGKLAARADPMKAKRGPKRKKKLRGLQRYEGTMKHLSLLVHWAVADTLKKSIDRGSIPGPDGKRYSIPSVSFLVEILVSRHMDHYMDPPEVNYSPDDGVKLMTHEGRATEEALAQIEPSAP